MGEDSPGVIWSIWAPEAVVFTGVVFTMKSTKAAASSSHLACAQDAVLPCCAGFCEGVLRLSLLRETSFPH